MDDETQSLGAGVPSSAGLSASPPGRLENGDEKSAPWAIIGKGSLADAAFDARGLAASGKDPRAKRIVDGFLSAADLVAIMKARREWEKVAPVMMSAAPVEEVAAFRINAILAVLGPLPGEPFTSATVEEAGKLLVREDDRRKRLAQLPHAMTCGGLLATDFPPPQWIVPELLTQGLTILAGAPKLGKSWLALALCAAVGSGGAVLGRYRVARRRALYLCLEDTPRRLKSRLEMIGASPDSRLDLFTQWRSGAEGIADLDAYLEEYPDTKLVLIDTLARFRGTPTGDDRYAADYAAAASIKAIADKHECAIVLIHHTRKMIAEDVMDSVSGTNGLNGAADSTWILSRARGEADASLFITGRDVEEQTLALRFDRECGTWAVLGDAAEYSQGQERRAVLGALPSGVEKRTSEIALAIGKKPPATAYLLSMLEKEGLVRSPSYGKWLKIAPETPESTESKPSPSLFPESTETESKEKIQDFQDFQGDICPSLPTLPASGKPAFPLLGSPEASTWESLGLKGGLE